MNILILQGSPSDNGNTDYVINMLKDEISENNHVEITRIVECNIEFCDGCNTCQESRQLLSCKFNDEFNDIIEKMKVSDLVIVASPLYTFGFPAQLKRFIDRMYSAVQNFRSSRSHSFLEGTKMMLLLTALGPESVCSPCLQSFKEIVITLKAVSLGEFAVPFCRNKKSVKRNSSSTIKEVTEIIATP